MRALVVSVLALTACASSAREEQLAEWSAGIIGGSPSGDDERGVVYVETAAVDGNTVRCSGLVLAPRLVVSARHCFLHRAPSGLRCKPDGSSLDLTDSSDLTAERPERVTVYLGSQRDALRPLKVRRVVMPFDVTVCRADIAFLVLEEPAVDARIPLRRAPVKIGERLQVAGWGNTGDDQPTPPLTRSRLDSVRVADVGPGLIPAGTFAVGGNSLCFGDSGAGATVDGALVGVYSRIDGSYLRCELEYTRNVFTAVAPHADLVDEAYAEIGERPWYADESVPDAAPPTSTTEDAGPPPPPSGTSSTCRAASVVGAGVPQPATGLALLAAAALLRSTRARRSAPRTGVGGSNNATKGTSSS